MSVTKNTQRNYSYKKTKVIKDWAKKAKESEIYSSVLNRLISGMTQQKMGHQVIDLNIEYTQIAKEPLPTF